MTLLQPSRVALPLPPYIRWSKAAERTRMNGRVTVPSSKNRKRLEVPTYYYDAIRQIAEAEDRTMAERTERVDLL